MGRGVFLESIYGSIESELQALKKTYILAPELWQKFHAEDLGNIDFSKWLRVKMLDENGELSDETNKIPLKTLFKIKWVTT